MFIWQIFVWIWTKPICFLKNFIDRGNFFYEFFNEFFWKSINLMMKKSGSNPILGCSFELFKKNEFGGFRCVVDNNEFRWK